MTETSLHSTFLHLSCEVTNELGGEKLNTNKQRSHAANSFWWHCLLSGSSSLENRIKNRCVHEMITKIFEFPVFSNRDSLLPVALNLISKKYMQVETRMEGHIQNIIVL